MMAFFSHTLLFSGGLAMVKRIFGVILVVCSGVSWFGKETFKAWFFDQVIRMNPMPILNGVIEYGPPIALAIAALWLLTSKRAGPPQPNMRLEDVVKRITGKDDFPGANESGGEEIRRVCEGLRQKAVLENISTFGGINWRTTRPADYDRITLVRIPAEYWKDHRIDVIEFLGPDKKRGRTIALTGTPSPDDYYGIWFDKNEIDALWPAPRRKIDWRNPINWKSS